MDEKCLRSFKYYVMSENIPSRKEECTACIPFLRQHVSFPNVILLYSGNPWLTFNLDEEYVVKEEYKERKETIYYDDTPIYVEPTASGSGHSHSQVFWPTPPTVPHGDVYHRQKPQENENFKMALDAVMNKGVGFCRAARTFGVNSRTLWLECRRLGFLNPRSKVRMSEATEMR